MEGIEQTLAKNLKLARRMRGLSQEDLAELSGIDRTYVSGVERAVRNPTIKVLERLSKALEVPVGLLITEGAFFPLDGK